MTLRDFFKRIRIAKSSKKQTETIINANSNQSEMEETLLKETEWIEKGINHENAGEYDLAADCYKKAADCGSPPAMHFIGNLFFYNKLGKNSTLSLGSMPWHNEVIDVPDYENAFMWYLKAAEHDFPLSMLNVGNLYYYGKGVTRDNDKSRYWLEKAMSCGEDRAFAAFYTFFGEKRHQSPTDEQYLDYLHRFTTKINERDPAECDKVMEKLLLGTEKQFHKLGMVLAKGFCSQNNLYNRYNFVHGKDKYIYAPVHPALRADWATTFIINLDAFDEEYPIIGFAIDLNCDPIPRKGLKIIDIVQKTGQAFGWLPEQRTYTLMQANRKTEMSVINRKQLIWVHIS